MTIFEHDRVYYSTRKELQDPRVIQRIRELNRSYNFKNEDDGIFTLYADYLKAKSYVGFAFLDSLQIQVLPKIYRNEQELEEKKKAEALAVFLKMLDISYNLGIKEKELTKLLQMGLQNGLHEVFIYLFAKTLWKEIERGYYREYVEVQSEEKFFRGKLLLTRQIRKLPHQIHTFSVEYYDFTEDNLLNRIFYATTLLALRKTRLNINKKLLSQLILIFSDVIPTKILKSHVERIHFTRLNERFKVPFNLAVILLFGFGGIFGEEKTFGFFVDMNHLFQKYVYEAIKKEFSQYEVKEEEYIGNLVPNKGISVRPDIVIKKDNKIKLIVEVKYKEISEDELIKSCDLYQIYAYSRRADTDVVLIYPKRENFNEWLTKEELEFFDNHKIVILPFDLSEIPKQKDRVVLPREIKDTIEEILKTFS
ncbi:McrC family protein [Pyrococcus sp. ST04]|uniref:McrC family protein n=1 Tax=Pyrococcus sp. ST04 TaxID=1183377 RepID=UPI000A943B3B|nr:restriction endonuclease [Pyrococcus sp. ST04]